MNDSYIGVDKICKDFVKIAGDRFFLFEEPGILNRSRLNLSMYIIGLLISILSYKSVCFLVLGLSLMALALKLIHTSNSIRSKFLKEKYSIEYKGKYSVLNNLQQERLLSILGTKINIEYVSLVIDEFDSALVKSKLSRKALLGIIALTPLGGLGKYIGGDLIKLFNSTNPNVFFVYLFLFVITIPYVVFIYNQMSNDESDYNQILARKHYNLAVVRRLLISIKINLIRNRPQEGRN